MKDTILPKITNKALQMFPKILKTKSNIYDELIVGLESLRNADGVICAAPTDEYSACWLRDQMYSTLAYFYLEDYRKFRDGIWIVFDILLKHKEKIDNSICYAPVYGHEYIHAKFNDLTYEEITKEWGHHQLDAIGLFLFIVGFSYEKKVKLIRNRADEELIQLLVSYLTSVRYWEVPDNGMWEEETNLHASSIGACVAGLTKIKKYNIAVVPQSLIDLGSEMLYKILPNESLDRDEDLAQLSLIWPYNILSTEVEDVILRRITNKLVQKKGVNRYLNDNYYRSQNGISAEWTMGFFWLSIVNSQKGNKELAKAWFKKGLSTKTKAGDLPELYYNNKPNKNTPLAWSHALALIAAKKLKK